jgi:pimeloyl-ACP methyl ester carboxylesterase
VVHGAGRNPDDYFRRMLAAVSGSGPDAAIMVIAPHFQTEADDPGPSELTWSSGGWKRGHLSRSRPQASQRISSYEAVDRIIGILADTLSYPRLEKVVVTGHSAGGQYTHRFAATSPAEEAAAWLRFRYIVLNPSTYLYLGPERSDGEGGFAVPDRSACPSYNEWHYGLEDRNTYARRLTEEGIRSRLLERDVVYMVGTADTLDAQLDTSCGAMLQGRHRYERGLNLLAYLSAYHPGHGQPLHEVRGVGHSSSRMYRSPAGRRALLEW